MITVIYGPPGAGKTTYIEQHRKPGDIVIDFDAIAVALGSEDSHEHSKTMRIIAGSARASAIRKALELDADTWIVDTWLRTRILIENQNRDGNETRFVLVDPGIAVATSRARQAGRPAASFDAIERWYANPPRPPMSRDGSAAALLAPSVSDLGQAVGDWW